MRAMIEKDVVITTKYGRMPSFAVCPDGPGQYPGIIFYMDAPGIREELRNMARRIARHGYFCLLPDMYYRLGHLCFLDAQDKAEPGPVGHFGYCISGQYITSAAAFFPHRIASAASLYAVGII